MKRILVTGGAGFIGSHACKRLSEIGCQPIVYDNLSTGHAHNAKWGPLIVGDILDGDKIASVLLEYKPTACIHFAALAYVGESMRAPDSYYKNNVQGTISLCSELIKADVKQLVFSSSCATYGLPARLPIDEKSEQNPVNPYGASKHMCERIISDFGVAYGLSYACLRYFNASGADADNVLQEEHDPETHLIPRCLMAAAGIIDHLEVFGTDYETFDGTCIRDYIHVSDLVDGHVNALRLVESESKICINLGSGTGYSIREIIAAIERITMSRVPHYFSPRRPGDPASLVADITLAQKLLSFHPVRSNLDNIISTAWWKYR